MFKRKTVSNEDKREKYISKAKLIYGDQYDYTNTNYVNALTRLSVLCKEKNHGIFSVDPRDHLENNRTGCPICIGLQARYDTETFVKLTKEIHGDRYNYDQVEYISTEIKVARYLDNHKIAYIPQYRFEDCKHILSLPFDFYLQDLNILIEYDG